MIANPGVSRPFLILHDRSRLCLLMLFALEALLFYTQVADQIAPYYPMNFDQTSFYLVAYQILFDLFRREGWWAFVTELFGSHRPHGPGFPLLGALFGLIGGPHRAAVLSVNLAAFYGLQWAAFHWVRSRTQNVDLSWITIALFLSAGTLFTTAGGLFDFRADFTTFCLYGVWVCTVLWSDILRNRKRAIAVAAVAILVVSIRFFTVVYIAAVFSGLLLAALLTYWRSRSGHQRKAAAEHVRNILLSGIVTAVGTAPLLISAREMIYNYYFVGHVLSDEKYIRAREAGVHTVLDHILYYPRTIWDYHIGEWALWLCAALLAVSVIGALLYDRDRISELPARVWRFRWEFLALGLATMAPLVVLTINISKSGVVGDIVVVPIFLLLVLLCAAVFPRDLSPRAYSIALPRRWLDALGLGSASRRILRVPVTAVVSSLMLAWGLTTFLESGTAPKHHFQRFDLERINAVNEAVVRHVAENGVLQPKMSMDRVVDYLNAGTPQLVAFERLHRSIAFEGLFGHGHYGIFATPRDVALKLVMESDIIVLTDPARDRTHPYPMNAKIQEYWGDLWDWTTRNRIELLSTEIASIPHHIFVRPQATMSGLSGGWITSAGIVLRVDLGYLSRFPFIVMTSDIHYQILGGAPRPTAVLISEPGNRNIELPVQHKSNGNRYQLVIDARAAAKSATGRVEIALTFDRFFVPAKVGAGNDTRELVLYLPQQELRASQPQ